MRQDFKTEKFKHFEKVNPFDTTGTVCTPWLLKPSTSTPVALNGMLCVCGCTVCMYA